MFNDQSMYRHMARSRSRPSKAQQWTTIYWRPTRNCLDSSGLSNIPLDSIQQPIWIFCSLSSSAMKLCQLSFSRKSQRLAPSPAYAANIYALHTKTTCLDVKLHGQNDTCSLQNGFLTFLWVTVLIRIYILVACFQSMCLAWIYLIFALPWTMVGMGGHEIVEVLTLDESYMPRSWRSWQWSVALKINSAPFEGR